MRASQVMIKDVVTVSAEDSVQIALNKMRGRHLRNLPVVDGDGVIVGVFSTLSVIAHIVPGYIASGDLGQVSFVPDIGVLREKYETILSGLVGKIMDTSPLIVRDDESLLAIAAELLSHDTYELALVADKQRHLLGVTSATDILDFLKHHEASDNA